MQCSNVYPYCHIMFSRKLIPGRKHPLKDTHMEKAQFLLLCLPLRISFSCQSIGLVLHLSYLLTLQVLKRSVKQQIHLPTGFLPSRLQIVFPVLLSFIIS